jgi:hypothetical protein
MGHMPDCCPSSCSFCSTVLNISSNKWGQGYTVATAGAIAVLVGNFAFMFAQDSDQAAAYYRKDHMAALPPPPSGESNSQMLKHLYELHYIN